MDMEIQGEFTAGSNRSRSETAPSLPAGRALLSWNPISIPEKI